MDKSWGKKPKQNAGSKSKNKIAQSKVLDIYFHVYKMKRMSTSLITTVCMVEDKLQASQRMHENLTHDKLSIYQLVNLSLTSDKLNE